MLVNKPPPAIAMGRWSSSCRQDLARIDVRKAAHFAIGSGFSRDGEAADSETSGGKGLLVSRGSPAGYDADMERGTG